MRVHPYMLPSGQLDDIDGTGQDMDSETTSHRVELVRVSRRGQVRFRGRCECGATSDTFPTAGMVWGWETTHRDTTTQDSETTPHITKEQGGFPQMIAVPRPMYEAWADYLDDLAAEGD